MGNKRHYLKKMTAWLLPYTCILCNTILPADENVCSDCLILLPVLNKSCPSCAYPLLENTLCSSCLIHPLPFHRIHALYRYEFPLPRIILELKFKQSLVNARVLGELLAQAIQKKWYKGKNLPDIIIPVPLHPTRLKKRGFNQAVEIARPISKAIKRPIDVHTFIRTKATAPQATLHALERSENMQQAFGQKRKFSYSHAAIIDDVMTTGETIKAFCKILKQAGVTHIDVWCCARASLE